MTTYGVVPFVAEQLDFVGPWDVFRACGMVPQAGPIRLPRRGWLPPPPVPTRPAARWMRDGDVVASQGVSARVDMPLRLVGQLHGRAHARTVPRCIRYDPAPLSEADG